MNYDKNLFGLSPKDFTLEQIKKIPSPILWKYVSDDTRFEDEFLSRIETLADSKEHLTPYIEATYYFKAIASSERLVGLINRLAEQETSYEVIQPYFNILTDVNKQHAMTLFLESNINLPYERFLDIIAEKYRYIASNSSHLVRIIFELLNEKRPRPLVLSLIKQLSKEKFLENYGTLKNKSPNSILGCLFYYAPHLPETEHLMVLRAMSKLSGLHHIKDKKFVVPISPALLTKLSLTARLNVLKDISILQNYPFTHKVSISFIKNILFPLMFKRSHDINLILNNWEILNGKAASLMEYPLSE